MAHLKTLAPALGRPLLAVVVTSIVVITLMAGPAVSQPDQAQAEQQPRLSIEDLDYQGAFRLKMVEDDTSRSGNASGVIGLGPEATSLFVAGHPYHRAVAEFPLADPSTATTVADLPISGDPVQPFTSLIDRVPGGNPQQIEQYSGLLVVDGALIANGYEYYDAPADNTHTTLAVADADDLAGSSVVGWGEMNGAFRAAGWLSPIPDEWQTALGGTHLSGSSSGVPIIGRTSVGPSAYVVDLEPGLNSLGGANPVLGFSLDNPLASDLANDGGDNDLWTHLSRATYGFIVPGTSTYLTIGYSAGHRSGISYGDAPYGGRGKGYYPNDVDDTSPYYWLWDVNDMVAVADGTSQPHELQPYAHGEIDLPFADFSADEPERIVAGATYDPASNRLYISIGHGDATQNPYEATPLILTYSIDRGDDGSTGPGPATDFCPTYEDSTLYRARSAQITVGPDEDWEQRLAAAPAGTEVLLEDGTYEMTRYAVYLDKADVTIRSASGRRDAVTIRGQGYGVGSEGFMIAAAGITIAELSMTDIRDHAISLKPEAGAAATHVYNVNLYDNGTQQIKASGAADNLDGVVACSAIGYTPDGVQGDYIGAIDLHRGIDWVIRDNYIYNVTGDGSGCIIDTQCGTYVSHPAILIWNNSRNAVVERNTLVDNWRGITLGLGNRYDGGTVRNNFVHQSEPGDAGIELWDAHDVIVEHNTVISVDYPGAIEYGGSPNVTMRNNLVSAPPLNRPERGASPGATIVGNITDAGGADFESWGEVHLAAGSRAIGAGVATTLAVDIEGDPRSGRWDVGADQYRSGTRPQCAGMDVTVDLAAGDQPTNGDDVIRGTAGSDVIEALDGDDVVCALGGDDTVTGGGGDDTIIGGSGDDSLAGNAGADRIVGGPGADSVWGGSGADRLIGGSGADRMGGGSGADSVDGSGGPDQVSGGSDPDLEVLGGDGDDRVSGGAGSDGEVRGQAGDDIVGGGGGNDTMYGDDGNDILFGGRGKDTIYGGNGDDALNGGNKNDRLFGNDGDDALSGGSGIDLCDTGAEATVGGDQTDATCESVADTDEVGGLGGRGPR